MKHIIVTRPLTPGEEVVVIAKTAVVGESVRFVRPVSATMNELVAEGVCVGAVDALETPTTQAYPANPESKSQTANVFRDLKRFRVKE